MAALIRVDGFVHDRCVNAIDLCPNWFGLTSILLVTRMHEAVGHRAGSILGRLQEASSREASMLIRRMILAATAAGRRQPAWRFPHHRHERGREECSRTAVRHKAGRAAAASGTCDARDARGHGPDRARPSGRALRRAAAPDGGGLSRERRIDSHDRRVETAWCDTRTAAAMGFARFTVPFGVDLAPPSSMSRPCGRVRVGRGSLHGLRRDPRCSRPDLRR